MFRVCHVPQAGYNLKGLNGWGTASTAGAAACDLPPSLTANDGVGDYNKVQHDRPTASGGGADATSHKHNTGVSYTSTVNQSAFAAACSAGHWYMINTPNQHSLHANPPKSRGPSKRVIRWCLFERDCTSDASARVSAEDATAAATQHAATAFLPAAVCCASIRKPCSAGCLALLLDVDALTFQHC